ncbi:hypothetical protein KSP40_PGU019363 [Platanthera guangdongensis]|uniref:Uncharacterized protein n=1 Tax=Platanthera guangdongensis TaxID=2320717 RepID=A0ABR2M281_9ASPA
MDGLKAQVGRDPWTNSSKGANTKPCEGGAGELQKEWIDTSLGRYNSWSGKYIASISSCELWWQQQIPQLDVALCGLHGGATKFGGKFGVLQILRIGTLCYGPESISHAKAIVTLLRDMQDHEQRTTMLQLVDKLKTKKKELDKSVKMFSRSSRRFLVSRRNALSTYACQATNKIAINLVSACQDLIAPAKVLSIGSKYRPRILHRTFEPLRMNSQEESLPRLFVLPPFFHLHTSQRVLTWIRPLQGSDDD